MVPPSTARPNTQPIQQFLSTVLSQRGPTALPYSEDTKWLIREQLVYLVTAFPSLEPKTATYTHNDGRTVHLLKADGTIPMPYHGTTYNIPIIIWLLDSFPRHPPCVYVNPTRDMIIKRPHPHVNPSGLVSIPYLQNWVYPTSNLVDLCKQLGAVFSHDPPLYSQLRNPNPSPSPSNPNSNPSLSNLSSFGAYPSPRPVNRPNPSPSPSPYPPSPYGGGRAGGQSQTDDAAEVYRRNAVNKIIEMVHNDVEQMRSLRQVEMEGLLSAQAVLKAREEVINKGVKELQDEKEGLEAQLQVVLMNSDVLDRWVRENEGKLKEKFDGGVNVDDVFECADVLSKQMLECAAADLAIEDVVYSLDKAVQDGAVPFDQYLRNVRLLSREQFFHRATAAKVRAAQMQAQVASMAARVPHYAS